MTDECVLMDETIVPQGSQGSGWKGYLKVPAANIEE
ncbi:hypothetical protein TcasGA2_TC010867 [Tribolium castaneum]|uniref:Uncharacterized protein n=1 Tax=Tribolium castaneum TaxID=7070 RepID=D6W7Q0_TRICA|nr:hypothetical protein TcasGA2_TC010867 [Tribolium castaneum]